jgi:hypothetical protein
VSFPAPNPPWGYFLAAGWLCPILDNRFLKMQGKGGGRGINEKAAEAILIERPGFAGSSAIASHYFFSSLTPAGGVVWCFQ